ncbi:MAG TPA: hypothetical protein VHE60_14795 [Pyrinomonadaceae bacterium]|nr:hypothetical protein [Pyrinomonadaceae bacterium]
MDQVKEVLRAVFTYVLYPVMVLAIFFFIIAFIVNIVSQGKNLSGRVRRLTGAFLPLMILIFVVLLPGEKGEEPIRAFLLWFPKIVHLLVGAVVGFALIEVGRILMRDDDDTGPSVYALFLSFAGVFMIYSIMQNILGSLNYFLFGMIVVAGVVVIFKGPPWEDDGTSRRLSSQTRGGR